MTKVEVSRAENGYILKATLPSGEENKYVWKTFDELVEQIKHFLDGGVA